MIFSPLDKKLDRSLASPVHGEGLEVSRIANLFCSDLKGDGFHIAKARGSDKARIATSRSDG
jgi:hypothetical protein